MPIAASMFSFDLFGLSRHRPDKVVNQAMQAPKAATQDPTKSCKDVAIGDKDGDRSNYHAVILGGFFPIL